MLARAIIVRSDFTLCKCDDRENQEYKTDKAYRHSVYKIKIALQITQGYR